MVFCAECKRKSVFVDNTGQPAEFCSHQCRKAAVEQRKQAAYIPIHWVKVFNLSKIKFLCHRSCSTMY